MKEIEIGVYCYSEREDVGMGFSMCCNFDTETIEQQDNEWLWSGMAESFWENHEEFEPGIEKAKRLVEGDSNLTYRQALYSIFGDFCISYEVKGKEIDIDLGFDANQVMYDMLEI